MGAYMGKPSTEKNATSGHTDWFTYGVSSMQGWRVQQEDAHNCVPDFDPIRHASLFAVYDGHGGAEVAEYCANHLPDFLRKLPAYSDKDPAEALKQLFLDFDASLLTPEARSVLRSLMKKSSSDDDLSDNAVDEADDSEEEENDSDINALCAEAEQPLESVLKRYGGEEGLPSDVKDLLESRKQNETDESGPSSSHATSTKRQRRSSNTASTDSKDSADQKDDSAETKVSESTTVSGPDADETSAEKTDDAAGAEQDKDDDDSEDDSVDFEAAAADNEDEEDDSDDTSDSDEEDEDDDDDDDDEDEDETGFRLPAVLKGQSENEPGVDSGTTACVALLLPMDGVVKLFVANAGDSRAVLCRGAAAVELSVDHKPEDEDERSRITAAGGTVTRDGRVNGGLNLSRALGDHCYKQTSNLPLAEQMITPCPDVTQFDLIPGSDDFLVIACDGVWNSMTSQEVVDFIYTRLHPNPAVDSSGDKADVDKKPEEEAAQLSQICGDLFDRCLAPNTEGDGTGCDNMTCIIVRFRDLDSLAKLSPPKSDQLNSSELAEGRKRAANGNVAIVTNGPSPKNGVKRLKTDLPEDTVNAPVSNGESVE